ncbi:MAG TPA: FecR domain-containing protein, partial [Polyangiaceae bacterium]|nr:FecR domain-containing protein [Polyangiaceae bacterium]
MNPSGDEAEGLAQSSDQHILEALRGKDLAVAAELLEETHAAIVGRACMALLGSQTEAEAVLRETLLAVLTRGDGVVAELPLRVELLAGARRSAARNLEARPRQAASANAEPLSAPAHARRLLTTIRPSEREALVLRYVAGLSQHNVALACGIDATAAQSRLSRGVVKLREGLASDVPQDATRTSCARIDERLASVLDGDASAELLAHVAECDACRDARYEAERAESSLREAGRDFQLPEGFARALAQAAAEAAPPPPMAAPPPAAEPAAPRAPSSLSALGKRWAIPVLAAAIGAAVLVSRAKDRSTSADDPVLVGPPWRGKVAKVLSRTGKLELCAPSGSACHEARAGDEIPAGSELRTDRGTLAELAFSDGSNVSLDRESSLRLSTRGRGGELLRGGLVADVQPQADSSARFEFKAGHLDVLGTKLSLRSDDDSAVVHVARGEVRLFNRAGGD